MIAAPEVAVLIPARNEELTIAQCLEHVLAQDIGCDRMEVVVVDGDSTDNTAEVAAAILEDAGLERWLVHRNPGAATPSNLNAGLALVRAPFVCRVDARSLIPADYLRVCRDVLVERPEVAVVGGAQVAVARSPSSHDVGLARALNNRYGMGLSRYRRGAGSGVSDTVYLGGFRTDEVRGVSGWDERLGTNQDFDLNRRLSLKGTLWFESSLKVGYLPRETVRALLAQYRRFGRAKVRYWRLTGDRPRPRQIGLMGAVPLGGALLGIACAVRRSRRWSLIGVIGTVLAIEQAGSQEPAARSAARFWSVCASGAVAAGWSEGVWEELLMGRSAS